MYFLLYSLGGLEGFDLFPIKRRGPRSDSRCHRVGRISYRTESLSNLLLGLGPPRSLQHEAFKFVRLPGILRLPLVSGIFFASHRRLDRDDF